MPYLAFGTDKLFGQECQDTLNTAVEAGFRHIDTAAIYKSETDVGQFISQTTVPREDLFITSKAWITQYRGIREACLGSLERLGVDYLDLYLLHWPFAYKSS